MSSDFLKEKSKESGRKKEHFLRIIHIKKKAVVTKIEKLTAEFNQSLQNNVHIHQLVQHSLTILIQTNGVKKSLALTTKKKLVINQKPPNSHDVYLRGQDDEIRSILLGSKSLKKAVENKEIELKASFRHILLLDSIFLLNRRK